MTSTKWSTGAFVFSRSRGLQPRLLKDLLPLAQSHGIPADFIPTYAGDRVAVARAITQASAGLHREGFLLRPITRSSTEVVYGIVKEDWTRQDRAKVGPRLRGCDSLECRARSLQGPRRPPHRPTRRRGLYDNLRGMITSDDWSSVITACLESHDDARVRGDGRVYWIPPQRLADVKTFSAFLAEVGIDLITCEIEAESRTVVTAVAQQSLDELSALTSERRKPRIQSQIQSQIRS